MTAYRGSHPRHHGSGAAGGIPGTRAGGIPDPRYAVVIADFVPPQKVSPRTQSASGFCPGRYNPLADSVRGDTIRQRITRNFGRSLRIPDASMQTSVNFPRTRPLTCMEQSAFLFSINQESTEKRKAVKNIVKNIFHYALLMKQKNSGSICRFHGPKTTRP